MRALPLLLCLTACSAAPLAPRFRSAGVATAALVDADLAGVTGPLGAPGPTAVLRGSDFVDTSNGTVSLAVPSGCFEGAVLQRSGGSFVCAFDDTSLDTISAGPGLYVSQPSGVVTVSVDFGTNAGQVSRGSHDHFADTFTGGAAGYGLVLDSAANSVGWNGVWGICHAPSTFDGEGRVVDARAGVVGRSIAPSGGVGVAGDSTVGVVAPTLRMGVAGYAGGTGTVSSYGSASGAGAIGALGVATQPNGAGVWAENGASGNALLVNGDANLSGGAVVLPMLTVYGPSAVTGAVTVILSDFAGCPSKHIALDGGCVATGNSPEIDARRFANTSGACTGDTAEAPVGVGATTGFTGYCCRSYNAFNLRASALCLKVQN